MDLNPVLLVEGVAWIVGWEQMESEEEAHGWKRYAEPVERSLDSVVDRVGFAVVVVSMGYCYGQ